MNKGDGLVKVRSCSVNQLRHRTIRAFEGSQRTTNEDLRDVAFGEALRAMTFFGCLEYRPGTEDRTRTLLEQSYQVMCERRKTFTPEDFALYFLSRLIDEVGPAQRDDFRHGAAEYMLARQSRLSREIAPLAQDARELLERTSISQKRIAADPVHEVPGSPVAGRLDAELATDEFVFGRSDDTQILLLTDPIQETGTS